MTLAPPPPEGARQAAEAWAVRARDPMILGSGAPVPASRNLEAIARGTVVVGLGESTHGSHETFLLKNALLRELVESRGFTIVAFEANRGELKIANDYIQLGTSSEGAALAAFGSWAWRTQEVLALLRWLRGLNATRRPEQRVQLVGVDVQSTAALASTLGDWSRRNGGAEDLLVALAALAGPHTDREALGTEEWRRLRASINELPFVLEGASAPSSLRDDARVLAQALAGDQLDPPFDYAHRDRAMAENVLSEAAKARVVVWAHAGHVSRGTLDGVATMGEHLAQALGSRYLPMLVSIAAGGFRAFDATAGPDEAKDARTFEVSTMAPDLLETVASNGSTDAVLLDLRASVGNARAWFDARVSTRWAGAFYVNERATRVALIPLRAFDAIVVAPRSTPSVPVAEGF